MSKRPVTPLLRARLSAGLTQAQLAEATGFSQAQISFLERGERRLNEDSLNKLTKVLGLRPAALLVDAESNSWQEGFDAGVEAARRALDSITAQPLPDSGGGEWVRP